MTPVTRYLPDSLYWGGALRTGLTLDVSADGHVLGASDAANVTDAVRLPGRALLPGLVNGHSHAFQRLIRGATEFVAKGHERDDFWSWREPMYRAAEGLDPEQVFVASRQVFLEMALAGITSVGEFHYLHHRPDGGPYDDVNELAKQVIRAARDVGLRIALLRVGYFRSGFQVPENPRQRRFKDARVEDFLTAAQALRSSATVTQDGCVSVGLAPHSVRAVPRAWLEEVARAAWPTVHMHVSEQPAEIEACIAEHGQRPVQLIESSGLLSASFTAVHAIHLADDEIRSLGRSGATVCACPTTERNLGDGVVPADALLAAGTRISLGSDSQATVDVLDEARLLEGHLRLVRQRRNVLDPGEGTPQSLARRLFEMATVQGARSLGLNVGVLQKGSPADFITVDLGHPSVVGAREENILPAIVFGADKAAIRDVFVQGRPIVRDGIHPLKETSAHEYAAIVRRLFQ